MTERLPPPTPPTGVFWGELRALTEDASPHPPTLAYALARWAPASRPEALAYATSKLARRHQDLQDALQDAVSLAHQGRTLVTGARLATPGDVDDAFARWAGAIAWLLHKTPDAHTSLWLPTADHQAVRLTYGRGRARVHLERPSLPPARRGRPAWVDLEHQGQPLPWTPVTAAARHAFGDRADPDRFAHVDAALLEDRLELACAWLMHMTDRKRAHRLLELVVLQSGLERLHVTLPKDDPLTEALGDAWLQARLRPASLTMREDPTLLYPECQAHATGAKRTLRALQPEWLRLLRGLATERNNPFSSRR